ncbi:MAG: hypothetical protein D6695_07290 [Planctomycetota bacterium]|nr:MAG: hypothetical protein D6695_07290 [Planctomycetota bacterium]
MTWLTLKWFGPIARLAGLASLCLLLGGCIDAAHLADVREQAVLVREELAAEMTRLQTQAHAPDVDPMVQSASQQAAEQARVQLEKLDRSIEVIDHLLESQQNPDTMINEVATALTPLLPEPLRSPVLLLGALGAALFRAVQLKRAAGSIARSIAKVSEKDEQFRSAIQRHADTLRVVQTPTAQRIVDEKVRPGFMVRLPI